MSHTSRPEKVLYPDAGFTKEDVVSYYRSMAQHLLPHLENRFLTLHRFPDGIDADGFYQQSRSEHFDASIRGVAAPRAGGEGSVEHIVVDDERGLLHLADQAALAIHGWQSRCDRPNHPDRLVFDLDPPDGDFRPVIDCARLLREQLDNAGLTPFVMTTGSSGLHVVCPLDRSVDFETARDFAKAIGDAIVERAPDRFTREHRKKKRRGRLYVDVGRNAYGQTAIMPYSLRALPGAPVATPLDWDELGKPGLGPRSYRLDNVRRRLGQKEDPWRDFFGAAAAPSA